MLPWQLPDLTSPCCMQGKSIITCDRGGRWLAFSCYKWGGGRAPIAHLFPFRSLLLPFSIASSDTNGAVEKVLRRREGEGPSQGARLSGAQAWTRPSPQAHRGPRSHSGADARGRGRSGRGSPVDEGRHAMVARPPRPCFDSAEVLPEFVGWSENPAGSWLQLPRFFAGELPASGPSGLWL